LYVPAPDGRAIAVLNGDYQPASVSLLDIETVSESSRVEIGDGHRIAAALGEAASEKSASSSSDIYTASGIRKPVVTRSHACANFARPHCEI
jgi:hypothetical protein